MVILEGIAKRYKKQIIFEPFSASLGSSGIICIAGENGSGKSTLLSIMAGVAKPSSGSITYTSPHKGSAVVAYLPQQEQLFTALPVSDNLKFWAAAAGHSYHSAIVQEQIEVFRLRTFLTKKVADLSGGMRRRLALCITLLKNPDYLLLDEPFTGLDLKSKEEIADYLKALARQGKTIIYTAHNMDEIYNLAEQLFIITQKQLQPLDIPASLDKLYGALMHYLKGDNSYEHRT